ncbi:Alpha/Beta hydrolase protein [Podospora australis]|uniref:Alpha/Beta hydrolase protein n=1 Tax=Podospora australis TaxID=1536484 RepID=A0AAN6WLN6_9PEZI|nr:Alpha/Beta hydrolase protein [Podospora australis]
MSTHQTAKTLYVQSPTIPDTKYAYRRLGTSTPGTPPLLILTHFRGVMDTFDPLLVNTLSSNRRVILFDYAGVGLSTGKAATTVRESANHILEFLSLIHEPKIDILGFSLGGIVAQLIALNADPAKLVIRKLILAGTTPSAGEGILSSPNEEDVNKWAGAQNVDVNAFKVLFFPQNKEGDDAAEQWFARIHERNTFTSGEDKVATWLSQGYADGAVGLQAQVSQLQHWGSLEGSEGLNGSFARLGELTGAEVLVVNGHDDYMIPTVNSFVLQQKLPNGHLIVYPNSGHGAIFQYASLFSKHAQLFLGA